MALLKQSWLATLWDNNHFYFQNDKFLRLAADISHAVFSENGNEFINFQYAGPDPGSALFTDNFRTNGTTELPIYDPVDVPERVKMYRTSTPQMMIPAIDLYALPYDKKGSVSLRTSRAMMDKLVRTGIYNVAPQSNTQNCPVINVDATNATNTLDGKKKLLSKDLVSMRVKLDNRYPDLIGYKWTLLVDIESYWDLIFNDPILSQQQIYQGMYGKVMTDLPDISIANFNIVCDGRVPFYTGGAKKPVATAYTLTAADSKAAIVLMDQMTFCKAFSTIEYFDQLRHPGKQADFSSAAQQYYLGPWGEQPANFRYAGAILRTP
ncbi:MAG: hypothetical protein RLZZ292_2618 [Bacteroidota bacterium]|jgi:hypothetical protein